MTIDILKNYITKRYQGWLDYATYHCCHAGMEDESIDVLNEVLVMLLEKCETKPEQITSLYEKEKGEYRELDFFVLQMIKLNIQSPTSPYRHKYRPILSDENADLSRLDIIDEDDNEVDRAGEILQQMNKVRDIFNNFQLSKQAKTIFSFKFFEGNSFSEWEGPEDRKILYDTYNKVLELIKDKLNNRELF